ncbi:MAG: hypothetical protein ACKOKA_01000 [Acidimicrobiaceae bacterium]
MKYALVPDAYENTAFRVAGLDVSVTVKSGEPVTTMFSLNVTSISTTSPALYVSSAVAAIVEAVGPVVSITSALFAPSEFDAPGDGSVSVALLFAASLIVPPPSESAPVVV